MIKKLTKHGNSHALVIDKAVLELLKIDIGTELDISTDGRKLIVRPVKEPVESRSHSVQMGSGILDDSL